MKKEELIDAVLEASDLDTKRQAQDTVNSLFDVITQTLSRGEDVVITGFGTFRVSKRAARMGVNPKTGEKIQISATTVAKFKAGKQLKDAVKG
jgi:DNA-binding protein HU-beta